MRNVSSLVGSDPREIQAGPKATMRISELKDEIDQELVTQVRWPRYIVILSRKSSQHGQA